MGLLPTKCSKRNILTVTPLSQESQLLHLFSFYEYRSHIIHNNICMPVIQIWRIYSSQTANSVRQKYILKI